MKVRFVCNWDDSLNINNRIISNYITDDNYDSNIILTSNSDYDYLIVFNSILKGRTKKDLPLSF